MIAPTKLEYHSPLSGLHWTATHFPRRRRTLRISAFNHTRENWPIDVPGLVLAVPYHRARPIGVWMFLREQSLASLDDEVTVGSGKWNTGPDGAVCMGESAALVNSGAMTPEDAFWGSSFSLTILDLERKNFNWFDPCQSVAQPTVKKLRDAFVQAAARSTMGNDHWAIWRD